VWSNYYLFSAFCGPPASHFWRLGAPTEIQPYVSVVIKQFLHQNRALRRCWAAANQLASFAQFMDIFLRHCFVHRVDAKDPVFRKGPSRLFSEHNSTFSIYPT
jgi:hypothetical protein